MKITVLVDGNEFFEYASVFHTIDCDRSAGSFSVECGVLFVRTERGLFVGDPYDEDSYRVEEIESLPGDAHRALLDSGDVLNIQCENPLDSYIFQQLQASVAKPEDNKVFDSITVVFSPDGLSSCDVYRDPDDGNVMERNFALSLHVSSSGGTRRLRLSEFGNVLHNRDEISTIDFVGHSLACHLANGVTVERELKLAGFLTKIINDLQEMCRNPACSPLAPVSYDYHRHTMKTEPRLHEALHATITTYGDVSEYVAAIESLGLWERLTTDSEEFVPWLHATINYGNSAQEFFYPTSARLLDAIEHNADVLAGCAMRLRINFFHLDYPDALLAAGVQQSQIRFDPSWLHPVFDGWIAQHHRDLGCLLSNERIREELSRNFRFNLVNGNVDAFLGAAPAREFLSSILERWRDHRRELTGFVHEWAAAESTLKLIAAEPRLREINPQAVAEILHCDAAEVLAARLRLGTLVEYTWPAFEQGARPLISADKNAQVGEAFPYVSVRKCEKLVLFDGETTRSLLIPDTAPPIAVVWHAFLIDDDVLIIYENAEPPYDYEWMWLSDCQPHLMPDGSFDAVSFSYPPKIGDQWYIGGNTVLAAVHRVSPVGIRLGFGPTYVADAVDSENLTVLPCGECMSVEEFDRHFAAGTLNGLDIPEAAAVTAESGVPLSFSKSFTATATDSTAHSPCGVDGNRLYGVSFSGYLDNVTFQTCFVSPLGTFYSHKIADFFAVEKPASTVWYVCEPEFYDTTIRLYDAATENQIAPSLTHTGDLHVLNYLRPAGFHQLRVRNKKVSAKMRACTTEQARALIDDPVSILDFAEGDETLAAAIAGIIAQIRRNGATTLTLPTLESVPKFLTYLYSTTKQEKTNQ